MNSAGPKPYITYILHPKGTSSNKVTSVNYSNKALVAFDTGGYTGDWDSSGKVAILHEKKMYLINLILKIY